MAWENNSAGSSKRNGGSATKSFLLYILFPALIAGFFSFLPKLYDIVTEQKAQLRYRFVSGPSVGTEKGYLKIYSMVIENSGKLPLKNVAALIKFEGANIETFAVDGRAIQEPESKVSGSKLSITSQRLHPNEVITSSMMVMSLKKDVSISSDVRSDEVLGELNKDEVGMVDGKKITPSVLISVLGSALSALSVGTMAFYALVIRRTGRRGIFGAFSSVTDKIDRNEVIGLVVSLTGLNHLQEKLAYVDDEFSYARASDIIFAAARNGDEDVSSRCVKALKSFLLNKNIHESSCLKIKKNIEMLDEKFDEKEYERIMKMSKEIISQEDLREKIIGMFDK